MAKLCGSAHILDLRDDLIMVRHNGGTFTKELAPSDLGLDDFSSITPTTSFDVYDDGAYVVAGTAREQTETELDTLQPQSEAETRPTPAEDDPMVEEELEPEPADPVTAPVAAADPLPPLSPANPRRR